MLNNVNNDFDDDDDDDDDGDVDCVGGGPFVRCKAVKVPPLRHSKDPPKEIRTFTKRSFSSEFSYFCLSKME